MATIRYKQSGPTQRLLHNEAGWATGMQYTDQVVPQKALKFTLNFNIDFSTKNLCVSKNISYDESKPLMVPINSVNPAVATQLLANNGKPFYIYQANQDSKNYLLLCGYPAESSLFVITLPKTTGPMHIAPFSTGDETTTRPGSKSDFKGDNTNVQFNYTRESMFGIPLINPIPDPLVVYGAGNKYIALTREAPLRVTTLGTPSLVIGEANANANIQALTGSWPAQAN